MRATLNLVTPSVGRIKNTVLSALLFVAVLAFLLALLQGQAWSQEQAAPHVAITSPANHSTVSSNVSVNAEISDPDGHLKSYRLQVVRLSDKSIRFSSKPVQISGTKNTVKPLVNTGALSPGLYRIEIIATDSQQLTTVGSVTVNVVPSTPSAVHIEWPHDQANVSGVAGIYASIQDVDNDVISYNLRIIDADKTNVFSTNDRYINGSLDSQKLTDWDTTRVANGSYTVILTANDRQFSFIEDSTILQVENMTAQSYATSSSVDRPDMDGAHVNITHPASKAAVGGSLAIRADIIHQDLQHYRGIVTDNAGLMLFDTGWLPAPSDERRNELVGEWETSYYEDGEYIATVYGQVSGDTLIEQSSQFSISNKSTSHNTVTVTQPSSSEPVQGWNKIHATVIKKDLSSYRGAVEDQSGKTIFDTGWLPAPSDERYDELVGEWETSYYEDGEYTVLVYAASLDKSVDVGRHTIVLENNLTNQPDKDTMDSDYSPGNKALDSSSARPAECENFLQCFV